MWLSLPCGSDKIAYGTGVALRDDGLLSGCLVLPRSSNLCKESHVAIGPSFFHDLVSGFSYRHDFAKWRLSGFVAHFVTLSDGTA